jgi:hypothetical protein
VVQDLETPNPKSQNPFFAQFGMHWRPYTVGFGWKMHYVFIWIQIHAVRLAFEAELLYSGNGLSEEIR